MDRIVNNEIKYIYPLTATQEGILFHSFYDPDSKQYVEQLSFSMYGKVEFEYFNEAIKQLYDKYDILRTVFMWDKLNSPKQIVLKHSSISLTITDISTIEDDKIQKQELYWEEKERICYMDLTSGPLFRIHALDTGQRRIRVICTYHHIILDGWSMCILLSDFMNIYMSLVNKTPVNNCPSFQFNKYVNYCTSLDPLNADLFWASYLEEISSVTNVIGKNCVDFLARKSQAEYKFSLGEETSCKIIEICKKLNLSEAAWMKAVWCCVLLKYNNFKTVVMGDVVSGRNKPLDGIVSAVGLFVETIPLKITHQKTDKFTDMVRHIMDDISEIQEYAYIGMAKIQANSPLKKDIITNLFVYENYPVSSLETQEGIVLSELNVVETTNYPFNLIVEPKQPSIVCRILYDDEVFGKHEIERIAQHIINASLNVIDNPDILISKIEMLSRDEKLIINELSRLSQCYSRDTIQDRFHKQVKEKSNEIALVDCNLSVTYDILNKKANAIAHMLIDQGISVGTVVAVMIRRSIDMVATVIAINKVGGVFVCINTDTPIKRQIYILEDCGCACAISSKGTYDNVMLPCPVIEIQWNQLNEKQFLNAQIEMSTISDPLNVVYTSGTSGKPKGIVIEQKTILNLLDYQQGEGQLNLSGNIMQYADSSFDVCYQEIFATLLSGGTLHIIPDNKKSDFESVYEYIDKFSIDTIFLPTAFFNIVSGNRAFIEKMPTCLTNIVVAGEQLRLNDEIVEIIKQGRIVLHNHYGPSETHVSSTLRISKESYLVENIPSIGKPVYGNAFFIVDCYGNPQSIGVPGEIIIVGINVARGYINQVEMTHKKFFMTYDNWAYRTGDLGVVHADGFISCITRMDRQIKKDGYRIEPAEVEHCIRNIMHISDAYVFMLHETLCASICSMTIKDENVIKFHLRALLPAYMIPSTFVFYERFPLTKRGKTDFDELKTQHYHSESAYYHSTDNDLYISNQEEKLAEIIKIVLGVQHVSKTDSFFDMGGDSIKAIRIVSRLSQYDMKLRVSDIFEHPIFSDMAKQIKSEGQVKIDDTESVGIVPMTAIQKYFFDLGHARPNHWNQSFIIFSKNCLDADKLKKCLTFMLKRHDILRMSFHVTAEGVNQRLNHIDDISLQWHEETFYNSASAQEEMERAIETYQASLCLEKAPLILAVLLHEPSGDHLLIATHHLIMDAVSIRILFNELIELYENDMIGKEDITLRPVSCSYANWAVLCNEYAKKEINHDISEFWRCCINKKDDWIALIEKNDSVFLVKDSCTNDIVFSKEETNLLITSLSKNFIYKMDVLLLAALGKALKYVYGVSQKHIMMESHGRSETIYEGITASDTVGWFTSLYPLHLEMPKTLLLDSEYLESINVIYNSIPNEGIDYLIQRYLTDRKMHDELDIKLEIFFNYLGAFDHDFCSKQFMHSPLSVGRQTSELNVRLAPMCITGMIINEQLTLYVDYHTSCYEPQTIKKLITSIKESLIEIAEIATNNKDKNIVTIPCYPLTYPQKNMYINYMLHKNESIDTIHYHFTLNGDVSLIALQQTYEAMIKKYGIFRTKFSVGAKGVLQQFVAEESECSFKIIDIRHMEVNEQKDFLELQTKDRNSKIFDLSKDTLLDMVIYQVNALLFRVFLSFHHIVFDGYSVELFLCDFINIYDKIINNKYYEAVEKYPYVDFIRWATMQDVFESNSFFVEQLKNCTYQSRISMRNKMDIDADKFSQVHCHISSEKIRLVKIALPKEYTLNSIFAAICGISYQWLCNQDSIAFGVVSSGRYSPVSNIDLIMGQITNTFPVEMMFQDKSIRMVDIIRKYQSQLIKALQYEYIDLPEVLKQSNVGLDMYYIFENYELSIGKLSNDSFTLTDFSVHNLTGLPLVITVWPQDDNSYTVEFMYHTNIFTYDEISTMREGLLMLFEKIIINPNISLQELKQIFEQVITNKNDKQQELIDKATNYRF